MSLCPIPCCMGFKRKGNEGDNDAVDIGGGETKGAKWLKTMEENYKEKTSDVADIASQKRSQGDVKEKYI